ncbi:MAG: site-specific DNA-methyltransferase [Alloprevotella sp.]
MELPKLELQSVSGNQLNLDALYQICPSCFTEVRDEKTGGVKRKVDFNVLRELLGENAFEGADEQYGFSWVGKNAARREAAKVCNKTLRPCPEESVDWNTTENLYIEGDNLEVLKLLQKSYLGKVKMIYIDPPYNTGNDFVYRDDFAMGKDDYDLSAGDVDAVGNRLRKNTDTNARFHSDWCSMIYERLLVARSLLTEDGVIFISIDEKEIDNLKRLCNEVFGENNFLSIISRRTKSGGGSASHHFAIENDFICVYAKNINKLPDMFAPFDEKYLKRYAFEDEIGKFFWDTMERSCTATVPYLIEAPDGTLLKGNWFRSEERFLKDKENGEIRFVKKKDNTWSVQFKQRIAEGKKIRTMFNDNEFKSSPIDLDALKMSGVFSFPKPVHLIKYLMYGGTDNESIILDFFSGSATTAHAVIQLNAEDGGKRKFIMVQLPEETDEKSEARKAGYANICEIGKERIRRAGKKIKEESPLTTQDLDTGFRVFKCEESFMNEVYFSPADLDQNSLGLQVDNVKTGTTDMQLLFGCMLDWGVQLSLPLADFEVEGKKIYDVNDGDLVACFAHDINENVIAAIAEREPLRVVFRDTCFAEAALKMNLFELFKQKCGWSEEQVQSRVHVI